MSLICHLYDTINHLKVIHIVYVCVAGGDRLDYPDYTGLLAASLIETTLFLNSTIFDTKGIMIHIMRPQVFFLGPANGAIIVHMNKNRPSPPIHYTTIQST